MSNQKRTPSMIGCAIGFGAAGCGVGSLVGMVVWPHAPFPLFEGFHAKQWDFYGGTYLGTAIGALVGEFVGLWYARRGRMKSPQPE